MPISEAEANKIFDLCDANKDGTVTRFELCKGLSAYFQKSMSVDDITVSTFYGPSLILYDWFRPSSKFRVPVDSYTTISPFNMLKMLKRVRVISG